MVAPARNACCTTRMRPSVGTAAKATEAKGGWETTAQVIQAHAREIERLWTEAQDFEAWLPSYESWKALPETKTLLGE